MLSAEMLVVQLSQPGPQDVLTTEEAVVGEDEAGDIHIQLVITLSVPHSRNVAFGILGLYCLCVTKQHGISEDKGLNDVIHMNHLGLH